MESKELFYILLIIILILNLLNKKETFVNLFNKKDTFLNSENKLKKNIQQNRNKNIIRKQFQGNFKNLEKFYDKRYPFEKEPTGKNKPLVKLQERIERLNVAKKKKEYVPPYELKNNSVINTGKPGFYIK